MADDAALIKTGNLPLHIASAACYIPFFGINFLSSIIFLLLEPKENTAIRFHAIQSLLFQATIFVMMIAGVLTSVVIQVLSTIVGSILGDSMVFIVSLMGMLGAIVVGGLMLLAAFSTLFINLFMAYKAFSGPGMVLPLIGKRAAAMAGHELP